MSVKSNTKYFLAQPPPPPFLNDIVRGKLNKLIPSDISLLKYPYLGIKNILPKI